MIRSMTAYARLSASRREGNWAVEIRSLNHRYLELSLKVPPALSVFEDPIREIVQNQIKRGKITIAIGQESSSEKPEHTLKVDEEAVRYYLSALKRLRKNFKLKEDISLSDLLKLPGVFSSEAAAEDLETGWKHLKKILERSLRAAIEAKEKEGARLSKDIGGRLNTISEAVRRIERHAAGRTEAVFKRLKQRLDVLLGEKEQDVDRIHREIAFLAEKSDITEEVVRMKSHLELFEGRLKDGTEVGRELDFLCQEMNREVNTMGAKSQLFEISKDVVFVKGELEKIREQIQNIE